MLIRQNLKTHHLELISYCKPETKLLINMREWKECLLTALGANAQIIIDVIPELKDIIGPQPSVPTLSAAESKNRFNRVFVQFVRTFTSDNPLVLFLDDLQWADTATLKLIELLMNDQQPQAGSPRP